VPTAARIPRLLPPPQQGGHRQVLWRRGHRHWSKCFAGGEREPLQHLYLYRLIFLAAALQTRFCRVLLKDAAAVSLSRRLYWSDEAEHRPICLTNNRINPQFWCTVLLILCNLTALTARKPSPHSSNADPPVDTTGQPAQAATASHVPWRYNRDET
jgi:hypothetical protein